MKTARYVALPLLALAAFAALAPASSQVADPPAPKAPAPQPPTENDDTPVGKDSKLLPVTEALRRDDTAEAARLLKSIDVNTLPPGDQNRYRRLSSLVALRLGDRAWLEKITRDPSYPASAVELLTIASARLLQEGHLREARALLLTIPEPDGLAEIPRRRYWQLRAKLAQLESKPDEERVYLTKLVDLAGEWGQTQCQACHASPRKFPGQVTTFDVARWWVGERYAAVIKADAPRVEAEARERLRAAPADESARLRLAYALRVQGKTAEAEAAFRELPWAEFPDRERRAPLRFGRFP
jgi:hypothetical protein